jgi:hypothetical protein
MLSMGRCAMSVGVFFIGGGGVLDGLDGIFLDFIFFSS